MKQTIDILWPIYRPGNYTKYEYFQIHQGATYSLKFPCSHPKIKSFGRGRSSLEDKVIFAGTQLRKDSSGRKKPFASFEAPFITHYNKGVQIISINQYSLEFSAEQDPVCPWSYYDCRLLAKIYPFNQDDFVRKIILEGVRGFRYRFDRLEKSGLWEARERYVSTLDTLDPDY